MSSEVTLEKYWYLLPSNIHSSSLILATMCIARLVLRVWRMFTENNTGCIILKSCAWCLIWYAMSGWHQTQCCVWLVSGGRLTQCFEITRHTQHFKIRHKTQHFKVFSQTQFSVSMRRTCIMSGIVYKHQVTTSNKIAHNGKMDLKLYPRLVVEQMHKLFQIWNAYHTGIYSESMSCFINLPFLN